MNFINKLDIERFKQINIMTIMSVSKLYLNSKGVKMKINIVINEKVKLKIKDIEKINSKFNEVDEFYLMRDSRTSFEKFEKSLIDDIKSVFLFFNFRGEFIGIKGMLSIKENNKYEVEFYPIFIDGFPKQKENSKYLYLVKKIIVDDKFDQMKINDNSYKMILNELKDDEWLPPKDSLEWKNFIDPYAYFVELKTNLLKKDFESYDGFEEVNRRVIKIDSNSEKYNNYVNKKDSIVDLYESNKESFLFIDYDEHRNNFTNDFLEKNNYYYSFSRREFSKNKKQEAENESRLFNTRFERKKSKLSFFQTNNFIDKKNFDLDKIKNSSLSKEDIELEVENFIASDIDINYEIISLQYSNILNLIENIKLSNNNFETIEELIKLKKNIENNFDEYNKLKNELILLSKKIKMNIENIDDEDIELGNKIIENISIFENIVFESNLNYFDKNLNELNKWLENQKKDNENKISMLDNSLKNILENELNKYDEQIEKINIGINELQNKLKNASNVDENVLNIQISRYKNIIKTNNDLIEELNNEENNDKFRDKENKILKYENTINEAKNKIEIVEQQLVILKEKKSNQRKIINDEIDNYKKEISKLKQIKIEARNRIVKKNKEEIEGLKNKLYNEMLVEQKRKIKENNIYFDTYYIEQKNIKRLNTNVNSILELIKDKSLKIISYYYDIKIYFNIVKNTNGNKKNRMFDKLSNVYVINTGDFVLVDTIKQIIRRVKRQKGQGDEILSKIIGKLEFEKFDENEIVENDIIDVSPSFSKLNDSQKRAFKNAISTSDPISIIQGPPGTGKTEVITELIKYFRNKKQKVIVSSQTNVAIKNVLSKLSSDEKIENSIISIWITSKQTKEEYSFENINNTWYKKIFNNLKYNDEKWNDIKDKLEQNNLKKEQNILLDISHLNDVKVFGATTTTSKTLPGRSESKYLDDAQVLIIDEVSKSILPEILRYAFDVKKVILVGDYKQLNPIFDINGTDFDSGELDLDKFKKLRNEIQSGVFFELSKRAKKYNRIETLKTNYRSLPGVLDAYNIFYEEEGGLKPYRNFNEFKSLYSFSNSKYFEPEKNLYFFNIKGAKEEKRGTSRYNKGEVDKIFDVLDDLVNSLEHKAREKDLAIIFPYAAQISLFTNEIKKNKRIKRYRELFKSINWDTVDSFQGSEAHIVILSTVVTKSSEPTFLTDFRRINVSLSRAKDMLLIFGNKNILENLEISGEGIKGDKYFRKILDETQNKYLKIVDMKVGEK